MRTIEQYLELLDRECREEGICLKKAFLGGEKVDRARFFTRLLGIVPADPTDWVHPKKYNSVGSAVLNAFMAVEKLTSCMSKAMVVGSDCVEVLDRFIGETVNILAYEGIVPNTDWDVFLTSSEAEGISVSVIFMGDETFTRILKDNCFDIVFSLLGTILSNTDLLDSLEYSYNEGLEDCLCLAFKQIKLDIQKEWGSGKLRTVQFYRSYERSVKP